ncbi:MAG TPA: KH domain-containing protein, partial [Candidatus Aveggerthella excrementigallinarum]|nr:KH domain-containing protein [Candidatus Aveggerthella excrementigallinarum]
MSDTTTDIAGLVRSVVEPLVEYKEELDITSGYD